MLLRVNGPILGRRFGDLIEVTDEAGQKILTDYPGQVEVIGEAAKRPVVRSVPPMTPGRSRGARLSHPPVEAAPTPEAVETQTEPEPITQEGEPSVDDVLASLNESPNAD